MEELKATTIFSIGPVNFTNAMLSSVAITIVLVIFAYFAGRNLKIKPGRFQTFVEFMIESIEGIFSSIIHTEFRKLFPFVGTFFIYILVANWFGLTPFVGEFGIKNGDKITHLLKPVGTDLNATIALGIISVIGTQYFGVTILGVKAYIKRFLNIAGAIEGILEPIKIVSLSFRLFGNIFAGEVVLSAVGQKILPVIAPLPFMFLEVGVGFLQALIFSLLTAVSLFLITNKEH